MNWYYAENDQQAGPVSEEELLRLVDIGRVRSDTLVWRQGMPDWKPFDVAERLYLRRPEGEPPPLDSGGPELTADVTSAIPAGAEPVYDAAPRLDYAGFWIRFVAHMLDGLVLVIVSITVEFLFSLAALGANIDAETLAWYNFVAQLVIGAAYVTLFLGAYGATPGKMALSLKVVRPDASRISYGRAFCRYLAEYLSAFTLLIGYIIAAFDSEKRTLHDRICDTRVIREVSSDL